MFFLLWDNFNNYRVSVPVVASMYLICRAWWVLSGMERDEEVLEKEKAVQDTNENIELASGVKNGNINDKQIERYPMDYFVLSIQLIISKNILNWKWE